MGHDAEDAEAEYWHAKGLGYTDEQILAMDTWPVRPAPETPAMRARRRGRAMLARDRYLDAMFDQDGTMSASEAAAFQKRYRIETGVTPMMYESTYRYTEPKPAIKPTMRTKEIAAQLRAQIAEAQKALELLDKTPGEPAEKLTTFGVSFDGSDMTYTYVALRINGKWTVTGRHFRGLRMEWHEIFERFDKINAKVRYMSTPVQFRSEDIER